MLASCSNFNICLPKAKITSKFLEKTSFVTSSPCSRMRRTKMTWMAFPILASWKIPATCRHRSHSLLRKRINCAEMSKAKSYSSPCSWWWRCRTPHYRCRGTQWVWSQPPPWSQPSALCWPSAVTGTEADPPPSAAPSPIPPSLSPPGRSRREHLQHGQRKKSHYLCGLFSLDLYSLVCTYANICSPAHIHSDTHLELHRGWVFLWTLRCVLLCDFLE